MAAEIALPIDAVKVRTTPTFTEESVPAGLLASHRVAEGVWGRLVMRSGSLIFRFEDELIDRAVKAGEAIVIPPRRTHHLEIDGPASFVVEFYKPA